MLDPSLSDHLTRRPVAKSKSNASEPEPTIAGDFLYGIAVVSILLLFVFLRILLF